MGSAGFAALYIALTVGGFVLLLYLIEAIYKFLCRHVKGFEKWFDKTVDTISRVDENG